MAQGRSHGRNLRRGRYSQTGRYYFLTTAVADRRTIFSEHGKALIVLETIGWLDKAGRFSVDAAVVMPDHVHLAGQLCQGTLCTVMHSLKSYSAHRLGRAGVASPIWQKGYHDHALRDSEDYRIRLRYLIDNPRRAGLVDRAEDYPYLILPNWW
jgi:REP element-mobilizing transposase RayT